MKLITTITMALAFFATSNAQDGGFTVDFVNGITVNEMDATGQHVIDSWESENSCSYRLSSERSFVHFIEVDGSGDKVKSWLYVVTEWLERDETITCVLDRGDGTSILVIFWKDASMVALETTDTVYIIY